MQVPAERGKENALIERQRSFRVNRVRGFSMPESLPGKKRSLSFSYWALLLLQGVTVSPLASQLNLSEVSRNFFTVRTVTKYLSSPNTV